MKVAFIGVGRDKKSWECDVASLGDRALIREIRRHSALMSRDIDFDWNSSGDRADIYVGGLRRVGEVRASGGSKIVFDSDLQLTGNGSGEPVNTESR